MKLAGSTVVIGMLSVVIVTGCNHSKPTNNLPGCGGPSPAAGSSPRPCDPNKPPIP
jgi:hypothetical protein